MFRTKIILQILILWSLNIWASENFLNKDIDPVGFRPFIRIGIKVNTDRFFIEGDAVLYNGKEKIGSIQGTYEISAESNFIKIGKKKYKTTQIKCVPKFSFMSVGKKIFRGAIEIINRNGKITAVNELNIEDYVKGVINKEIISSWPIEAKKAQAVLARTYAVYQKIYNPRALDYDLAPSVLDQVYGGLNREDLSANRAVNETAGLIITSNQKPAQIFFHSTCGGRTASAKEVWGKEIHYLKEVDCPYCKRSDLYRWKRKVSKCFLEKRLKIKKINSIKVFRGKSRIKSVQINNRRFTTNKFREKIGYAKIWSNDFTVTLKGKHVIFRGKGAGHGVGVCQWGMAGLSKRGKKFNEILKYYLEQTTIRKIY